MCVVMWIIFRFQIQHHLSEMRKDYFAFFRKMQRYYQPENSCKPEERLLHNMPSGGWSMWLSCDWSCDLSCDCHVTGHVTVMWLISSLMWLLSYIWSFPKADAEGTVARLHHRGKHTPTTSTYFTSYELYWCTDLRCPHWRGEEEDCPQTHLRVCQLLHRWGSLAISAASELLALNPSFLFEILSGA